MLLLCFRLAVVPYLMHSLVSYHSLVRIADVDLLVAKSQVRQNVQILLLLLSPIFMGELERNLHRTFFVELRQFQRLIIQLGW